jgi:site-specific recombinase XerD
MDPLSTSAVFEQFLAQRRYLKNVTPSTIEWYETAFKALQKAHQTSTRGLTKSSLQQFVVSLRQRGVKPISCNTYIKALNAFCLWLRDEGHHIDRLRRDDVDFDNLLVTVFGKGRKERRVPFSFELRKVFFRYDQARTKQCPRCERFFPSRQGSGWDQRNSLRGLHLLQDKLGLPTFGWHRLRHTFATNYLRQGGDIVRLSMVLGILKSVRPSATCIF